jgi:hypothetical protein
VVIAAGLSGLAQAVYLASGATLDASPTLRFGIGAWPALAAAVAAHLLYLLAVPNSAQPHTSEAEVADPFSTQASVAYVQQVSSNRPAVESGLADELDATGRPSPTRVPRPTAASMGPDVMPTSTAATPARARARVAALRHATRHGSLPTVSALATAADVSRGTAATVLKSLRGQPLPPS